jgi:hypothetical protein
MKVLALAFLLLTPGLATAATGMFGSYIQINTGTNVVYDLQSYGPTNNPDFNGLDFGDFTTNFSSLTITNASGLTYKNIGNGDNVTGVELQYRVYKVGSTPGAFSTMALNFGANATATDLGGNTFSGNGDQEWKGLSGGNIDLLSLANAGDGDYKAEVFFRAFTNLGDQFSNNGGSNFIAVFSVPEPSRAMLLALGLLVPLARRRR